MLLEVDLCLDGLKVGGHALGEHLGDGAFMPEVTHLVLQLVIEMLGSRDAPRWAGLVAVPAIVL
jgi:hypothetical protein